MLDDVYASLREGTFRGIFTGSARTEPISSNVHAYSEALKKYIRGQMPREELEVHRKQALEETSARRSNSVRANVLSVIATVSASGLGRVKTLSLGLWPSRA